MKKDVDWKEKIAKEWNDANAAENPYANPQGEGEDDRKSAITYRKFNRQGDLNFCF